MPVPGRRRDLSQLPCLRAREWFKITLFVTLA
jgi:hypothetical protein